MQKGGGAGSHILASRRKPTHSGKRTCHQKVGSGFRPDAK